MTFKFDGKGPVKQSGGSKPSGDAAKPAEKKIESEYSKAKAKGGTGSLGSGIGNS